MADEHLPTIASELTTIAPQAPGPPDGSYLSPAQHRARAMVLRRHNPNSRAAELHELVAKMAERRLGERGSDYDSPEKEDVAGISAEQEPAHANAAMKPKHITRDGILIAAALFLVFVYWPLWPLVVLWFALLAIIHLVERIVARSRGYRA